MKEEVLPKTQWWTLVDEEGHNVPKVKPIQAINQKQAFDLLGQQVHKLMKHPPLNCGWQYVGAYIEEFNEESQNGTPVPFVFRLEFQIHDMFPTMNLIGHCLGENYEP